MVSYIGYNPLPHQTWKSPFPSVPGVLEKQHGVADYQYFKNCNTQQHNILNEYNFHVAVCEVADVLNMRLMMGHIGL